MKVKEFLQLCKTKDLRSAIDYLECETDWCLDLHSEDCMKEMAKQAIDGDMYQVAIHIINGIYEEGIDEDSLYKYDRSMGTIGSIVSINSTEDLYNQYQDYCDDFDVKTAPKWDDNDEGDE